MSKLSTFSLCYLATFLQAGTYGLTFMLPRLFEGFGANEKHVGMMLLVTTYYIVRCNGDIQIICLCAGDHGLYWRKRLCRDEQVSNGVC